MPIIEIDQEKYYVSEDQTHITRDEILELAGRAKHQRWFVLWKYPGYGSSEMHGGELRVDDGLVIRTLET
jgi:hypothetical protein